MRKLYVIRENEEDGRLLDALITAGRSLDESEFENPPCPVCGCDTLLAYTEGDNYEVVTWDELGETEAGADAWFLVCSQIECPHEEPVELVADPMGALLFDQRVAEPAFAAYLEVDDRTPPGKLELISDLKAALAECPSRKVQAYLDLVRYSYDEEVSRTRRWIDLVPPGKLVEFRRDDETIRGTFLTATEEGFMILTEPGSSLRCVRAEEIYWPQPLWPDRDDLPKPVSELLQEAAEPGGSMRPLRLIMCLGPRERVVIRGYHLQLSIVDRFGRYHVRCWDREAATALGLSQKCENYWEGVFRRSEVDGRYDVREMVKVQGHWLDVIGKADNGRAPVVQTDDPLIGAELGLSYIEYRGSRDENGDLRHFPPSWQGAVTEAEVEERKEVRLYHWPLPESPLTDAHG
ncbi:MAG TPA: hypothetical protein VD969_01275 [Symbiobacteriaceae bacterium]|nr:hypothetical protein [Symbiobacteriaceae bacterium]